jgi:hypothetical protein
MWIAHFAQGKIHDEHIQLIRTKSNVEHLPLNRPRRETVRTASPPGRPDARRRTPRHRLSSLAVHRHRDVQPGPCHRQPLGMFSLHERLSLQPFLSGHGNCRYAPGPSLVSRRIHTHHNTLLRTWNLDSFRCRASHALQDICQGPCVAQRHGHHRRSKRKPLPPRMALPPPW